MDYNNLNSKIKRIYQSINQAHKYGPDLFNTQYVNTELKSDGSGGVITFTFSDPNDDSEILNEVHNIISNLANLKDLLKETFLQHGLEDQLVEDHINKSLALQLILDLNNQDKHGYPLTKWQRSKRDPLIKNLARVITPSNKPDNKEYSDESGAKFFNIMAKLHADIVDSERNHICTLDQLIHQAILDWNSILRKHNIIQ